MKSKSVYREKGPSLRDLFCRLCGIERAGYPVQLGRATRSRLLAICIFVPSAKITFRDLIRRRFSPIICHASMRVSLTRKELQRADFAPYRYAPWHLVNANYRIRAHNVFVSRSPRVFRRFVDDDDNDTFVKRLVNPTAENHASTRTFVVRMRLCSSADVVVRAHTHGIEITGEYKVCTAHLRFTNGRNLKKKKKAIIIRRRLFLRSVIFLRRRVTTRLWRAGRRLFPRRHGLSRGRARGAPSRVFYVS